jgi:hypothetical protein
MARQVDLISTSSGSHYLEIGMNSNELASFSMILWITKYGTRAVDWLQSLSLGWVSFMGGDVYVQNATEDIDGNAVPRNFFFGEQKYSEVGIVANENPNIIKLLDSIGISSDGKWSIESVTIPPTLNYPSGMESKIPKERFKKRDGMWQSEFLRNGKTTTGTVSAVDMIKGEPLRGESAYLVLRNTDTAEVKLFRVNLLMTSNRG